VKEDGYAKQNNGEWRKEPGFSCRTERRMEGGRNPRKMREREECGEMRGREQTGAGGQADVGDVQESEHAGAVGRSRSAGCRRGRRPA
jgi:hypothetical protein